MVCLKSDDKVVSGKIHSYGSWEKESVTRAMRAMEVYEDAVFIGNILIVGIIFLFFYYKMEDVTLVCIQ